MGPTGRPAAGDCRSGTASFYLRRIVGGGLGSRRGTRRRSFGRGGALFASDRQAPKHVSCAGRQTPSIRRPIQRENAIAARNRIDEYLVVRHRRRRLLVCPGGLTDTATESQARGLPPGHRRAAGVTASRELCGSREAMGVPCRFGRQSIGIADCQEWRPPLGLPHPGVFDEGRENSLASLPSATPLPGILAGRSRTRPGPHRPGGGRWASQPGAPRGFCAPPGAPLRAGPSDPGCR